ncbi:hypothetical protein BC832DRAFT_567756 [Gaertneriomyces semiglobifer]|nr:hypothetical protein BC832DRAFT_567756 [Gaertneriomyces semiglobifer]
MKPKVYIVGNTVNDELSSERYAEACFHLPPGLTAALPCSWCRGPEESKSTWRCSHGDAVHTAVLTWR